MSRRTTKKRKLEGEDEGEGRNQSVDEENRQQHKLLQEKHKDALSLFENSLDELECSDKSTAAPIVKKASRALLEIKMIQRLLFDELQSAALELSQRRQELYQQKLRLANLKYEEYHWEEELKACEDFKTPQLEHISRQEVTVTPTSGGEGEPMDSTSVMNLFLCGDRNKSFQDPSNNAEVITKLHEEINGRGILERDVQKARENLKSIQSAAQTTKLFLSELPSKVNRIESASQPLQKFFTSGTGSRSNPLLKMIGSGRNERFELASQLPGPMNTLFQQLQIHIDQMRHREHHESEDSKQGGWKGGDTNGNARETHPTLEVSKPAGTKAGCIQVKFPIPQDVLGKSSSSAKQHFVTVELAYNEEWELMTASTSGPSDKVNTKALLMNLFPGDDGSYTVDECALQGHKALVTVHGDSTSTAKPFHWCNYIAGIQCARAPSGGCGIILKELSKRVRSNTTLTKLLSTLSKRQQILLYPPMADKLRDRFPISDPKGTRLQGWKQVGRAGDDCVYTFMGSIRVGSDSGGGERHPGMVEAFVELDTARYPAVRPVWSVTHQGGSGSAALDATGTTKRITSWGETHGSLAILKNEENPLYDVGLGELESRLQEQTASLVIPDDEVSYTYILTHQLHVILSFLDGQ